MHEHSADGATNRKESANWLPTTPRAKGNTLRNSLFKLNLPLDRSRSELTRKALEDHFHINRPHTNPDLKLNDLAGALDVSQSDLSAFINREFGINFRRYVNRWRLAEHQRLMSLPSNERKNVNKIISLSGFSNLRHYHRVLETESPEKTAAPKTP
jgi:AraC-like DNA-binding protein